MSPSLTITAPSCSGVSLKKIVASNWRETGAWIGTPLSASACSGMSRSITISAPIRRSLR